MRPDSMTGDVARCDECEHWPYEHENADRDDSCCLHGGCECGEYTPRDDNPMRFVIADFRASVRSVSSVVSP